MLSLIKTLNDFRTMLVGYEIKMSKDNHELRLYPIMRG
jgi:hypothetical protein